MSRAVRPASTVLLVRDGTSGIEVALGLRPPGGPFGGVWVFPGGAVDDDDLAAAIDADHAWRLAALRETWEEVGLAVLDPPLDGIPEGSASIHVRLSEAGSGFATDRMIYLSNWVTPRIVPKRFDTRFYLLEADGELGSSAELTDARWLAAGAALGLHGEGDFPMMFPTISHLRYVSRFGSVDALTADAAALDVIPAIEPRIMERGTGSDLVVDNDSRFAE